MRSRFLVVGIGILLLSCLNKMSETPAPIKVAFLADVHLQDIYAEFTDTDYKGILNPETGNYNTVRAMGSQLRSTRLFNENYFAFLSALDDLVTKDIKLVVLPGDFSDDGQPINIKALKRILTKYTDKHGIQFFLTTGNHDPVKPFSVAAGKTDFLGEKGKIQAILSDSSLFDPSKDYALPPVITKDIQKWGYTEITNELSDFGFYPQKEFLYWDTPYSNYSYDEYTHDVANEESALEKRIYQPTNSNVSVPDATYLVEPIEGLWLLAIDGNVYIPKENMIENTLDGNDFSGASVGYNHVLDYKKKLISWVRKVTEEAKKRDKTLVAFSHYPMVEFNDGASEELKALFGEDKMQNHRIPNEVVSEIFADAGIQLHIGGHMHSNDTGIHTSKNGNTLFNVQVPSLAAYPSAYKVATLHPDKKIEIETISMDSVVDYNSLFSLYRQEYKHLEERRDATIWDKNILAVKSFPELTELHLQELVRLRFLKEDWPTELKNELLSKSGAALLFLNALEIDSDSREFQEFTTWTGLDMIQDFYRLKNGDDLAKKEIGAKRLAQYARVCSNLIESSHTEMALWGQLFQKMMNGQPSDHFIIDLQKGTLEKL